MSVLNTKVLVLNRSYMPVHVTSVRRALAMLYQDVARAVDAEYRLFDFASWSDLAAAEEGIGLVGRAIRVPRVILLQGYDRVPRRHVRFSRHNIYARDQNRCQYCGRQLPRAELNLDHVVPRSQGGRTHWDNVVCCCLECNLRKGGRTPEQAGLRLRQAPTRPTWTPVFRTPTGRIRYREWLPYLSLVDASYWNTELEE